MKNNIDLNGLIKKAKEDDVYEIHLSKHLPHYKTFFRDKIRQNLKEREDIVVYDYYAIYEEAIESDEVEEVKTVPSTMKGFNLYIKLKNK